MLPTEITKSKTKNPQTILIMGYPKTGKTTVMAELTRKKNFLLVDLENKDGSDSVEARKVKLIDWAKENHPNTPLWQAFYLLLVEAKKMNYEGIIIDNTSKMEELAKDWALFSYKKDDNPRFQGNDIYNAPHGAGYGKTREMFMMYKDLIEEIGDYVIYVGHVKSSIETKQPNTDGAYDINVDEVDLTGKLKLMMVREVSATGFLYRDPKKQYPNDQSEPLLISFKSTENKLDLGSRCPHLNNYQGEFSWDKIYID